MEKGAARLRFIAYTDYLCPWCCLAARRWARLEQTFEGAFRLEWRAYLLRPDPRRGKWDEEARARFERDSESWQRVAAEPEAGTFRTWTGSGPPPSHSVPLHVLARLAAEVSEEAFRAMHARLPEAVFSEHRDLSNPAEQRALWLELELPEPIFEAADRRAIEAEIRAEDAEARRRGVTGVPAVMRADNEVLITGAQPLDVYRRWIERSLARGVFPARGPEG